jgi:hypothetical protein
LSLAGATVAILASGAAAAVVLPASAQSASRAPAAMHRTADPLITVCLTIRELNFGPECLNI